MSNVDSLLSTTFKSGSLGAIPIEHLAVLWRRL
jgi:hypothetical protein